MAVEVLRLMEAPMWSGFCRRVYGALLPVDFLLSILFPPPPSCLVLFLCLQFQSITVVQRV